VNAFAFAPLPGNVYLACAAPIINQSQPIEYGERFVLRRVDPSFLAIGPQDPSEAPGGLKLRNARNLDRFSGIRPLQTTNTDILGLPMNSSFPICPELIYPVRGGIVFDLYGVKLRYNALVPTAQADSVPLSQLLFQGVRRFPFNAPDNRPLPDGWEERPYIYPFTTLVDWPYWSGGLAANGQNAPRHFTIPISDWDFELLDIRILNDSSPAAASGPHATVEVARMTLYDWSQTALSSAPVNLHAINSAETAGFGQPAGAGAQCPPLLYPNRSSIQFDLVSMLQAVDNPHGTEITIQFVGRRRWPRA
jgi:hypothetical protein